MPVALPNLDDRTYADLVVEARALIPTYAPEWTNHNPSDPGIALIELFAYLTEMLIYRLDRVTDANRLAFLKLINGPEWSPQPLTEEQLLTEERKAVLALRRSNRAVTCADFESLALAADPGVARARCVPRRHLDPANPDAHTIDRPDHMSVVIVPRSGDAEGNLQPGAELIRKVQDYLEPRRLLTTRVHVVGPRYVAIGVRLTLWLKRDAEESQVRPQAIAAIEGFLHPLTGGADGRGWPFGRNVYVSEIYELLDKLPGIDYVTRSNDPGTGQPLDELVATEDRLQRYHCAALVAVEVWPDELVTAQIKAADIQIVSPVGS